MQISAANLLIAAQQAAKAVPRPDTGAFAAALAKEKTPFEPLEFKESASLQPAQPARPPSPAKPVPLGSQVDIKV